MYKKEPHLSIEMGLLKYLLPDGLETELVAHGQ
jgi:hypothetical protein